MADDTYGLNKEERLKAERMAEWRKNQPPPLDPAFPYTVVPFDPLAFGALEEHEKET